MRICLSHTENIDICEVPDMNLYNQIPHLTRDTIWYSNKNTRKHDIRRLRGKEVSPFPAGEHKAAMNRQEKMTNTKHK